MWACPRRLCQRPCSNKLSPPFIRPGARPFSLSYSQICPSTECSFLKAVPNGPARMVSIRNRWLCSQVQGLPHLAILARMRDPILQRYLIAYNTYLFVGWIMLSHWEQTVFSNKTLKKIIAVTMVNRNEGNMMGSIITMTTVQGYYSDQLVNLGKALHGWCVQAMMVARAKGLTMVHGPGKNLIETLSILG